MTLLEMMVAMTLLTVIVLGLTSMFLQTQKAFKSGLKQVDVLEGGRSVISMITRDLEQMSDGQSPYITNFWTTPLTNRTYASGVNAIYPTNGTFGQIETDANGAVLLYRTNVIQDIYSLSRVGRYWTATGYAVSNTLTSPDYFSGVGTLYRYSDTTTNVHPDPKAFAYFRWDLTNTLAGVGRLADTRFHRVADGIVHLQIRAFDTNGFEVLDWKKTAYPIFATNAAGVAVVATNLPCYLEVELGMLEPETYAQAQSIGGNNAINFLRLNKVGRVHIFRQQIPIRSAPRQ